MGAGGCASAGPAMLDSIKSLKGGLVVSCQASPGEPLCRPDHILALCLSAIAGGALGLRLEGVENIRFVKQKVDVPIIGLIKSSTVPEAERLTHVYITATYQEAAAVVGAGADIVAVDATGRPRPDGIDLGEFVSKIHFELDRPVWADVATVAEGVAAAECGADVISTTLYGYTQETHLPPEGGPGFELLAELCRRLERPVVLEGRVWTPEQVARAFELGAYAVVVGSAITRPKLITRRFVKATPRA